MSVTRSGAIDALLGAFRVAWVAAGKSASNVKYDNTGAISEPPSGLTEFAIVRYQQIGGDLDGMSPVARIGGRSYTTVGLLIVEVYQPAGDDGIYGDGTAEAVQTAFRNFSSNANVRVKNVTLRDGLPKKGAYAQRNVTLDFEYDTVE